MDGINRIWFITSTLWNKINWKLELFIYFNGIYGEIYLTLDIPALEIKIFINLKYLLEKKAKS